MHPPLYHRPVMLQEALHSLQVKPHGVYIDLTFGGGSYSRAILERLSSGRLLAFDQDPEALTQAKEIDHPCFTFIHANFRFLQAFMTAYHIEKVDGIVADLGTSSHQLDQPERGFATRLAGPLDMRMNPASTLTATDIINTYPLKDLVNIFRTYGQIYNPLQLAKAIIHARKARPILTTHQLVALLTPFAPPSRQHKYYAKVFQALRITVNDELGALQDMLTQTVALLKPHARLVLLSYHSLEDRLVKYFIKTGNFEGKIVRDIYGNLIRPLAPLHNRPLKVTQAELLNNNRARSVRLRTATLPPPA